MRRDASGVEQVRAVCSRRRGPQGFRAARYHDVWVIGAELFTMSQAALQHGPTRRVQWHPIGPLSQSDAAARVIDVVEAQGSDFSDRSPVQQGEDADQGFMGVHVRFVGPPSK